MVLPPSAPRMSTRKCFFFICRAAKPAFFYMQPGGIRIFFGSALKKEHTQRQNRRKQRNPSRNVVQNFSHGLTFRIKLITNQHLSFTQRQGGCKENKNSKHQHPSTREAPSLKL